MKEWKENGALKQVPVGDEEHGGWKWLGRDMRGPICPVVKYTPGEWVRPPAGCGPLAVFPCLSAALSYGWEYIFPTPNGTPKAIEATLNSYSLWEIQWKPAKRLKVIDGRVVPLWHLGPDGKCKGDLFEWVADRTEYAGAVMLVNRVPKERLLEWMVEFASNRQILWSLREEKLKQFKASITT